MDEFFNFEDAAHPLGQDAHCLDTTNIDVSLAFSDPDGDEDSFTCLQHFSTSADPLSLSNHDTTMMGPDDFTDFPRWIGGMGVASKPCDYCQQTRIQCKIMNEGKRKGSCTSCVALARPCSLTYDRSLPQTHVYPQDPLEVGDVENDGSNKDMRRLWFENQTQAPPKTPTDGLPGRQSPAKLATTPSENKANSAEGCAKVGARFSRESLRVLKGWLSTHHHHPYPSEEEKEQLKRQTGLNKTQITNWLANARRRGKVPPPRSTSPSVRNYSTNAIDIPRSATPALSNRTPMERWKNSPPEHEPASVTAIARAVTNSTLALDHESPYTSYGHTDDGSNRSFCDISLSSSLETSLSSGSFASAFSHRSRGSFASFGTRGRRRRRRAAPKASKIVGTDFAPQTARTFQCTFCTETFKTKHDWQRHEKSLHLSLERWICSPNGPNQYSTQHDQLRCVYCGLPNPPKGHEEIHNHSSCAERSLEERTFYRKDHLRQHLNLVHDVKFQTSSMESWKVATPEIRSRCGFCGIVMDTWSIRIDHLAEHFKGGKSMADWKGDWGFEPQVLDIVENGIPPYLIHDERNSVSPFEGSKEYANTRTTLEDRVKIALVDYLNDCLIKGILPTDDDLLNEARTTIIKAETAMESQNDTDVCWFRDLIKYSGQPQSYSAPQKAGYWGRIRDDQEVQGFVPEGVGLCTVDCSKDRALRDFVEAKQALGLTPTDSELQTECCRILDEAEAVASFKCKGALSWFKYLITASIGWLAEFRRRAGLPRSSEILVDHIRNPDQRTIDHSVNNRRRLFMEVAEWVNQQGAIGITPSDADLQRQARLIIYENDDPWNQTAMDDLDYLHFFKRKTGLAPLQENDPPLPSDRDYSAFSPNRSMIPLSPDRATPLESLHWDLEDIHTSDPFPNNTFQGVDSTSLLPREQSLHILARNQPLTKITPTIPLKYLLNDANCYNRLVKDLARFVASCMSPNNPNQHTPSDAELQNQARWVIFDDDDPWNQTAADNAEWLTRFKRHVGLASLDSGPGLPIDEESWRVSSGGSGFSPPYLFPGPGVASSGSSSGVDGSTSTSASGSGNGKQPAFPNDVRVTMKRRRTYNIRREVAEHFIRDIPKRYGPPATVFCARELESGLSTYLKGEMEQGRVLSDENLRAKAREILGLPEGSRTAADEAGLLKRFREVYGDGMNPTVGLGDGSAATALGTGLDAAMGGADGFDVPVMDDALLAEIDQQLHGIDFGVPMDIEELNFGIVEGEGAQ